MGEMTIYNTPFFDEERSDVFDVGINRLFVSSVDRPISTTSLLTCCSIRSGAVRIKVQGCDDV